MTTPLRLLLAWAALMVLLALTVAVTFVPIGNWRMAISYAIAIAKAALVSALVTVNMSPRPS